MSGHVERCSVRGSSVRGWCPGALRPMPSGDGLVLRIRPHAGRLEIAQAQALAELAEIHGNGLIDLGSRAHLQLRGVGEAALPALHQSLSQLDLLDSDARSEARRNILTTPLHREGDGTLALVRRLEQALETAPDLPAKFGFAVDTGAAAILGSASADIRIERGEGGGLILRADGMAQGRPVTTEEAIPHALSLMRWFLTHPAATRMARLLATGVVPPLLATTRPLTGPPLSPGATPAGICLALPFGQMEAATLRALACAPLRLTPWRSLILEGLREAPDIPGVISDASDPLLAVSACTGAPGCNSAEASTRDLARDLAPLLAPGCHLHVSGCAKGCAHPAPAHATLTARKGHFDLIENGRADAIPVLSGLSRASLPAILRGRLDP